MTPPEQPDPTTVDRPVELSPQFLIELGRHKNLSLLPESAAKLAAFLNPALAALRAIQPDGYDELQPALGFRVPMDPHP